MPTDKCCNAYWCINSVFSAGLIPKHWVSVYAHPISFINDSVVAVEMGEEAGSELSALHIWSQRQSWK